MGIIKVYMESLEAGIDIYASFSWPQIWIYNYNFVN